MPHINRTRSNERVTVKTHKLRNISVRQVPTDVVRRRGGYLLCAESSVRHGLDAGGISADFCAYFQRVSVRYDVVDGQTSIAGGLFREGFRSGTFGSP